MKKEKLISKNDIILMAVLLIFAACIGLLIHFTAKSGARVFIMVDGNVEKTFELDKDTSYEVRNESGTNIVEIKDGSVSVTEADCPDKICVKHKSISKVGETIICLPHKLVVEIKE